MPSVRRRPHRLFDDVSLDYGAGLRSHSLPLYRRLLASGECMVVFPGWADEHGEDVVLGILNLGLIGTLGYHNELVQPALLFTAAYWPMTEPAQADPEAYATAWTEMDVQFAESASITDHFDIVGTDNSVDEYSPPIVTVPEIAHDVSFVTKVVSSFVDAIPIHPTFELDE